MKKCTKPGTFSGPEWLKKGSGFLILRYFFVRIAIAFLFCNSPTGAEDQPSMSSTVFILTGVLGLSFQSVGTDAILSTTSMPATTLPKAAYWPSR